MRDAITSAFKGYAQFSGRSSRPNFWYFTLFLIIAYFVFGVLDAALYPIGTVLQLSLMLPTYAVTTRRLHDVNRSGWWQLLYLTGVGIFLVIYWCVKPSDVSDNKYGPPTN